VEVFEAVRTVLAVRRFRDRPVPSEAIARIVEAGRLSASAQNLQPWHFVVIEERATLRAMELAVVPALVPHGLRNVSDRPARVLGFFASSTNVAIFTEPQGPERMQVFVVGAPFPLAVPLDEPVAV